MTAPWAYVRFQGRVESFLPPHGTQAAFTRCMTVLSVVTLLLVLGTLFVLIELGGAPVGFEDQTGFHAASQPSRSGGGTLVRSKDPQAELQPIVGASVAAR